MQGLFIHGKRPASKKAVKEALHTAPDTVSIEATSVFGNEYDGPADLLSEGVSITFVGPDPYTSRKFYGVIKKQGGKLIVQ